MVEEAIGEISIRPEIKKTAKQEHGFDISTLTINEEESKSFLKEGKFSVFNIKVAYDKEGHKVLLKSPPIFVAKDRSLMTRGEFVAQNSPELYEDCVRALQGEEAAWKMASYLGVPMAETRFIEIDDTPFIAYQFIEGVEDKGFGGKFSFVEPGSEKEKMQEVTLAKGALLKFILDQWGDGGQYLQDQKGNIYISDIALNYRVRSVETTPKALAQVASQGVKPDLFFATRIDSLKHQLNGVKTPEFQEVLNKLETITPNKVAEIIFENPTEQDFETASRIAQRGHMAKPIFNLLAENPDEAIQMLNPYKSSGEREFKDEEVNQVRMALFKKLKE